MKHLSSFKFFAFVIACVLASAGLFALAAPKAPVGHTGQALSLQALLHPALAHSRLAPVFRQQKGRWTRGDNGRFVYPRRAALGRLKAHAAANGAVTIDEPVQTFDVFLPPPTFTPTSGPLTPTNTKPVWSADGSYFVFSSNRTAAGGVATDRRFHIWVVSSAGDTSTPSPTTPLTLTQITSGTGDERDPALNSTNSALTFTSTANSPGTRNLYAISFPTQGAVVDVSTLTSLTINPGAPTGFSDVLHPTWSPDSARIAFAAMTTTGPNQGFTHIYYLYTATGGFRAAGSGSNPPGKLSDGSTNDANPSWSADGAYIFFDSTAAAIQTTGLPIAPNPTNPAAETTPLTTSGGDGHTRSIFAITPNGSDGVQVTNTDPAQTPTDDTFPALRTEADAQTVDLAFARSTAGAPSKINYVLGTYTFDPNTNTASTPTATATQALNSNDPVGTYSDTQPVWAPMTGPSGTNTVNSIAYVSNRTITYNDPDTNAPLETPMSVPSGRTTANVSVGASYTGILQSQIDQINPPTLLPFSGNEVIHVTDGATDTPRRNGDIQPGQQVKFTVRLSSREAGIDSDNVYIQIKDPDSKYQDADRLEHKVFTTDTVGFDSGSASGSLYNAGSSSPNPTVTELGYPGLTKIGTAYYRFPFFLFGVPGGFDGGNGSVQFYPPNGPTGSHITVGHIPPFDNSQNTVMVPDPNSNATPKPMIPLPGVDPLDFSVAVNNGFYDVGLGQEYEAQFIDAQFAQNSGPAAQPTDYGTPYYLAGVDDQGAHIGTLNMPRQEWLKLSPVVPLDASSNPTPDAEGGILYTATWTTPTSPSDFYLDVIAYDKAVDPATGDAGPNFRIYDNVWGFSTQAFSGINDILVVSDNALGQKFAATTFSGKGLAALRPLFFGAESYMTDVDVNILPNAVFQFVLPTGTTNQYTGVQQFGTYPTTYPDGGIKQDALPSPVAIPLSLPVLNGLGVGSYNEDNELFRTPGVAPIAPVSRNQVTIDGASTPVSQQYSLWRILSRGAVPQNVMNAYAPTFVAQPAVNDTASPGINGHTAPFTAPAATVPSAARCIVWVSPYTGDQPLNQAGSIADPATQQTLKNFLNIGGRLFVSGQDVGSSITVDGTTNNTPAAQGSPGNFLPDFLSASLATSSRGTQTQNGDSGAGNRISSDAFVNVAPFTFGDNSTFNSVNMYFPQLQPNGAINYVPPGASPLYLGNNYNGQVGTQTQWRADSSLDQLGPVVQTFGFGGNQVQAAIDTLTALNGAKTDVTSGGMPTLVYNENVATGARTVYAGFGLEGIGTEYYEVTDTNSKAIQYAPRNLRQNILHNIVCYLRTGTFTGQVVNGGGGGGGVSGGAVPGATVYLVPNNGATLPGNRQVFSGLTDSRGNYTISGVEPGAYTIVAYKQGFTRSVVGVGSGGTFAPNQSLVFAVEGDTSTRVNINLTPAPKGSITGKVTDANNKPINGATITFASTDGQYTVSATSGADGTYSVQGVTPDTYTGTASDNPLFGTSASQTVMVASSQTVSGINFVLPPGPGTLGGLVTDTNGNPVTGATITITNPDGTLAKDAAGNTVGPFTTVAATTPAAGAAGDGSPLNYSGVVPPGKYLVTASGMGYTTTTAVTVTLVSNAFTRQDFTLSPGPGVVGGLVTDSATGQPLAGATVTLTDTNGNPVTDSNGNPVGPFTTTVPPTSPNAPAGDGQPLNFNGSVPPGSYLATVSAPTYATTQLVPVTIVNGQFTRIPTASLVLTSTLGTVAGLVTDKATGNALAGATVTILDGAGSTVSTTQTIAMPTSPAAPNGDGSPLNYAVRLPAGSYTLTVNAPGHAQVGPIAFTITTATFVRKDAVLFATPGTLGGLVTLTSNNLPLSGATVTVTNPNGSVVKDGNGNTVGPFTTTTPATSPAAPNGDSSPLNYSGLVPPGTYMVTISAPNVVAPVTATVKVVTNAFARADAALTSIPGTLYGRVQNSAGSVIAGATISVVDGNGNVVRTLTSSSTAASDGTNYSGPLPSGAYTITASATNFATSAPVKITIASNTALRQDFTLSASSGVLGGLVTDTVSGKPLGGATVTITSGSKAIATTTTTSNITSPVAPNGDGKPLNYSLPLNQGTYTVTISARGYTNMPTQTATITVGAFTRADFTGSQGVTPLHVFSAGLNFFSVPYDFGGAGVGFDSLLGTLNTGTRTAPVPSDANRSHVFVYDPPQLQYAPDPTAPADSLRLGQGYWVFLLHDTAVTTPAPAPGANPVAVSLKAGWNMIGVPSLSAIPVAGAAGLQFPNTAGGQTLDFATASSNTYRVISGTLYGYNGSGYVPITAGGSLQPWQAYWIYAYVNTTVMIPTHP